MDKRDFLKMLLGGGPGLAVAGLTLPPPATASRLLRIQESPVAGFQHHAGEQAWPSLHVGRDLRLAREPDNRYDRRAVAVYAGVCKLGYVPRRENVAISQMLDRRELLTARVIALSEHSDPWQRVRFAVFASPG